MTETIKMTTIQGVRDAQKIEERDYREIDETGLAVARGGRVHIGDGFPEIDDFPWMTVINESGIRRAHVPAAVALAWLSPENRAAIRAENLPAGARGSDPTVKALVPRYNVWGWAIAHVATTPEEDLVIIDEKPLQSWSGKKIERLENVRISDYKTFLVEFSRPPSKGGNTSAMHAHTVWVDDRKFSFWARGACKFIFKDDKANFEYFETEDGYLNILPHTIVCRDAKGKTVRRGDRRSKTKLRSAPTRLPASRREARD
jgi:hypothetical protein